MTIHLTENDVKRYIFHMLFKVPAEHRKAFWVAFWAALAMCAVILWVLVR